MSGGKETPRQKMIGMMYLVLTALLALNVSSAVLEKFAILNTTLVDLIRDNDVTNEAKLKAILGSKSETPVVKDAMAKAQQVRDLAKETIKKLDDLKIELSKEHDGTPIPPAELVGNTNIAEEKMVNEKSSLATNYEKSLVDYTAKLQEYSGMKFPKLNKKAVDFEELKNEKGEVEHGDKSFIEFSFEGTPTMAAITGITQMQTEILEYEALALDSLGRVADAVNYKFDVVVPMVIGPSIVAAGAKYEGRLFMAGAASGVSPEMFKDGQPLSVTTDPETTIKMAKVEFTAQGGAYVNGLAKKTFAAEIRVAGKEPIRRTIEYMVAEPTIKVTTGNAPTLYMNCGNKVFIEVPSLGPTYNPTFSPKGATIEKGDKPGRVVIVPKEKKVSVSVSNAGALIGVASFDTKPIPRPRYVARDNSGKEVDLKNGLKGPNMLKISADAEDNFKTEVPGDANYRIRQMVVTLANGATPVGAPMNVTSETLDLGPWRSLYRPGMRIVVEIKKVTRKTYTGEDENVDVISGVIPIPIQ